MSWKGAGQKVLRWFVWLLLGFVVLRGVGSFIKLPETPAAAPVKTEETKAPVEPPGLRSLPPMFAREYLTWQPGNPAERSARLQPFVAPGVDSQAGWAPGKEGFGQRVDGVWVHSLKQEAPTRWQVIVAARVTTYQETVEADLAGAKKPVTKVLPAATVYLSVPVAATKDGGWLVSEFPALVPAPPGGALAGEPESAQTVTDQGDRVKTLAAGFFRAYLSGSGDVSYFLAPDARLPALQGKWSFDSISRVSLYSAAGENRAAADVVVSDPTSGVRFTFRYTLRLIERDGRWYIKDLLQKGE